MDIFEMATALGDALKQDEKLVALEAARKNYEADRQLQTLVIEYEVQQRAMQKEAVDPNCDTHMIDMIQNRIKYCPKIAFPCFQFRNVKLLVTGHKISKQPSEKIVLIFKISIEASSGNLCTLNDLIDRCFLRSHTLKLLDRCISYRICLRFR